jgi:hypothetical protein
MYALGDELMYVQLAFSGLEQSTPLPEDIDNRNYPAWQHHRQRTWRTELEDGTGRTTTLTERTQEMERSRLGVR